MRPPPRSPRSAPRGLLVALSSMAFVACEVAEPPADGDARDARDTRDAAETTDASETVDGLGSCNPFIPETGCADGTYCETTAFVCVDCVGYEQRCVGPADRARRETCPQPHATAPGELTGGYYESDPCASGEVCVPTGIGEVECMDQVCEPGFSRCTSALETEACNASGTALTRKECDAGNACYVDRCEPIRHNVVLIFDTSASMWSYREPSWNVDYSPLTCVDNPHPCFAPFPDCDDEDDPLALFTLSKNTFAAVVAEAIGGFSQFALERFPQRDTPAVSPSCGGGWYSALDQMTGDDDARTTDGATWFADNLGQVFVVPFPVRNTIDNTNELLTWLDHRERLGATPDGCTNDADCGDAGKCGDYNGDRRCFRHTDPELRAISQTPLGKSLFYAGEYIRRFVRVDGKPCTTDASCDSAGYLCRDNQCVDPYRKCKDDFIVLFTDGGESFHESEDDFFNPVVQAKRLAFGLDCQGDGDCRGDAKCIDQKCVGKEQTTLDTPSVAGEGYGALATVNGTPISIKTTVVTLNAAPTINARIAYAGGGTNVDVSAVTDASGVDALKAALRAAMVRDLKCRPEDIR